ncbi:MAG: 23S rRNA (adenine(2503)-C(2))-methyltransferase RlmN [Proteobacteria bacterium]|nr:23S rRNA (adenine(2503)-C(2))-methyltransferase RlmN [Pseudomonadota bacterium]
MKKDIKNMSLAELEAFLSGLGKERYRALQIFKWVYQHGVESFEEMTNLSKQFRVSLEEVAEISSFTPLKTEISTDGTRKYLFALKDGEAVESVLIPEAKRLTLCVSSQAGCPLDCKFCLTGSTGYRRNLETSEIISQITAVNKNLEEGQRITNIVFMGMGEPLLNYDNVLRAIGIITAGEGLQVPNRKVTLSTAGLVPQITALGRDSGVNLAVSLNATTNKVRDLIMPVNKKYPLDLLLDACRNYPLKHKGRITFEYVMIRGMNDSMDDAKRLVKLLRGIPSKVNLLPFNEHEGSDYKRPFDESIVRFHRYLLDSGLAAIKRSSRGADISAACGQLRGASEGEKFLDPGL